MEELDETVNIQTFFPGYDSVKSYAEDAFKAVITATKAAAALPECGSRYEYYQSFHGFTELMKEEGNIIFSAMTSLVKSQGVKKGFEDLNAEDAFELLVDINDVILENADIALDGASGAEPKQSQVPEELVVASVRTPLPINTSWNKVQSPSVQEQTVRLLSAKNIQRPQMRFKTKVDNSNTPFIPSITWKPNSIKPLAILPEMRDGKEVYGHPYEWEIEKFQPTDKMLEAVEPVMPNPLEETNCIYVENEDQLKRMCEDLSHQTEIAIDLEHHSYRSFQGIVCLMQISTRTTDYLVDTLQLRSELQVLNEIFTHPAIVKVLHGADMDILWLQRDFGLYVVNMFDTGQAARVLNFAHFSLAHILKHYCKIELNKAFQLADWRMRPLPSEMIKYAREDTHYLLYLYDCMKNDLLEKGNEVKNLLVHAFHRSQIVCLKVYEKHLFHEDSYLELYKKSKKVFNSRQLFALKEIYSWRDRIAREEDESIGYVLPNHMLLQIAEILPREQQGILACCNPIPPLVRQQLADLHLIIMKARESAVSLLLETEKTPRRPEINIDVDLENVLHCPHDVHREESLHLETLFGSGGEGSSVKHSDSDYFLGKQNSSLPLFDQREPEVVTSKPNEARKYEKSAQALKSYLSPSKRFKLVKKFNLAYKLGGAEVSASETERVHKIHNHLKRLAAVDDSDGVPAKRVSPQKPASENNSAVVVACDENHNKQHVEPLRKKEKKKKNKRKLETPEIVNEPLAETAALSADTVETETRHHKKKKTPEKANGSQDEDQKPSNCTETPNELSNGKEKAATKKVFNPYDNDVEYQTSSKHGHKKKKHAKQATFSHSSEKSHSDKNWPKR